MKILKAEPPKIEPIMIQKIQFKRDKIKSKWKVIATISNNIIKKWKFKFKSILSKKILEIVIAVQQEIQILQKLNKK